MLFRSASYKLAEEIYKTASENNQGAAGAAGAQEAEAGPESQGGDHQANSNGAEDADYRVVDDDDKK